MWHEYIARLLSQIGGKLAAIAAAIGAFALLVIGHRRSVSKAGRQGRTEGAKEERARVERETEQITEYLETRRDEIKQNIASSTATDSDLRDRMRRAAGKSGQS